MKTLFRKIIIILFFFSTLNYSISFADYIEDLLELKTWVERRELDLYQVNDINLKSEKYNKIQDELRIALVYLKTWIIVKYKSWEFWYYQTQGIINNYNNFIYYTNQFLYYLQQKEWYPNDKSIDFEIIKNYKLMKIYYQKVKNLTTKRGLN